MTPRRALAAAALAAVVATRVEPYFLEMPFVDREARARAAIAIPDSRWPQYPRFLEGVRAHTEPGDSIAIVMPASAPREMYPLAYYRAGYFLTGRHPLPVIDPRTGTPLPVNISKAGYVAVFGEAPASGVVFWTGEGGVLYRR